MKTAPRADAVQEWIAAPPFRIGQICGRRAEEGVFLLCHRDDLERRDLQRYTTAEDANEIARFDDAGNYRPLRTAPNLRRGWELKLGTAEEVRRALDFFYPGRLAIWRAWRQERLPTTSLRETLGRQTGMYRVAGKISDEQIDELVGRFCCSGSGCLRTILWARDATGATPSSKLPREKFDPAADQTGRGEAALPLFCQEACNFLVAEARAVVKAAQP